MSEEQKPEEQTGLVLTESIAVTKLKLALNKTENGIQKLLDAGAQLVYNTDNIESIKTFVVNSRKTITAVDTEFAILKKPSLDEGRIWDAAKKTVTALVSPTITKATNELQRLSKEVAAAQKKADDEAAEVLRISTLRTNFIMEQSDKIAEATTLEELLAIERVINLETGRKEVYKDQLDGFKEDCTPIRAILTARKADVKELSDLDKKEQEAIEKGDDDALMLILDKKEVVAAKVQEGAVKVQEAAVNIAPRSYGGGGGGVQVFGSVKARRSSWKYKCDDLAKLYKENPAYVTLTLNDAAIKELLEQKKIKIEEQKKKDKTTPEVESFNVGAIHFYLDKTY